MTEPRSNALPDRGAAPAEAPELLEVDIESLAYGGEGVAHAPRAIFVAGGAPGDRLRVRVQEDRGRWARAELVSVLRPGPDRRTPPCPLAGRCGGCQWQHVTEEAQRAAKRQAVEDALRRIGALPDVVVPPLPAAGPSLGYRRRARLQIRWRDGSPIVGFHAPGSHAIVDVPACIQMSEGLRRAHTALRRALEKAGPIPGVEEADLAVGAEDGPGVAAFHLARRAPAASRARLGELASASVAAGDLQGVAVLGAGNRLAGAWGDVTIAHHVPAGALPGAPYTLRQRAWAFAQASWEANVLLVRAVIEALGDPPPARLLELYAGSGNFTLPLSARCAELTAVEGDPQAAADLRENLARAGRRVRVMAAPVERALGRAPRAEAVLLDPPRAGAATALPAILARRPRRIVYVSCDPATLARDLRSLARAGYAVPEVRALDLFPQTYHVETVATCVRREG